MSTLLSALREGLASAPAPNRPAGIEIRLDLRPAGDLTAAPPSYEGPLEIHPRLIDGETRNVLELDSVGSAANRVEEALLALYRAESYPLPVAKTTITTGDHSSIAVSTLEMPHRTFDAWLRLSENEAGVKFEDTPQGQDLTTAHTGELDALLETSTHDLLLGVWDSHRKGPHGQLRIARSLTTSLIGIDPIVQQPIAARRDPLNLGSASELPKGEKLSELGLSSIPPQRTKQTVSIERARYIGYLSFPALRRLDFKRYDPTDVRALLALLALYGLLLRDDQGWDLRSGAVFVPSGPMRFSIARPGSDPQPFDLDVVEARRLLDEAVTTVGIKDRKIDLQAGSTLNGLVAASITNAKKQG